MYCEKLASQASLWSAQEEGAPEEAVVVPHIHKSQPLVSEL